MVILRISSHLLSLVLQPLTRLLVWLILPWAKTQTSLEKRIKELILWIKELHFITQAKKSFRFIFRFLQPKNHWFFIIREHQYKVIFIANSNLLLFRLNQKRLSCQDPFLLFLKDVLFQFKWFLSLFKGFLDLFLIL